MQTQVKTKMYCRTKNIKMENNELKKVSIKNCTCYCFGDIMKFEDLNFDILIDEKSSEKNFRTKF